MGHGVLWPVSTTFSGVVAQGHSLFIPFWIVPNRGYHWRIRHLIFCLICIFRSLHHLLLEVGVPELNVEHVVVKLHGGVDIHLLYIRRWRVPVLRFHGLG